jgi:hypothetical protein
MSTKEWILFDENEANLYQELSLGDDNNNPATIEVTSPADFYIESETFPNDKVYSTLRLEIPANRFDALAIAWCKTRRLHGALGGPVGREFGSPDYDELHDDEVLRAIVEQRLNQDEVEVDIDADKSQQPAGNQDVSALRESFKGSKGVSGVNDAAEKILSHIQSEQRITDEGSLLVTVQQALQEAIVQLHITNEKMESR